MSKSQNQSFQSNIKPNEKVLIEGPVQVYGQSKMRKMFKDRFIQVVECYKKEDGPDTLEFQTACPETVVLNVYKKSKGSKENKLKHSIELFVKEGELPGGLCICGYDEALKL